jgi:hypothetical protein
MEFRAPTSFIRKPQQSFSFQFSPSPSLIVLAKKQKNSDTGASCKWFNVSNASNTLKVHVVILLQTLRNKPSQRLTPKRIASPPNEAFQTHFKPQQGDDAGHVWLGGIIDPTALAPNPWQLPSFSPRR